jgi:hypothetical protein
VPELGPAIQSQQRSRQQSTQIAKLCESEIVHS